MVGPGHCIGGMVGGKAGPGVSGMAGSGVGGVSGGVDESSDDIVKSITSGASLT